MDMDSKVSFILTAARKRFAHYGIAKTTMNEIAADIGMSKAALYYYFTDKERIFVAVVEQDLEEFVNTIEQLIERPSKPSFKLKKYVSLRNDVLDRLLNLARVESLSPSDVFNPVFDDLKKTFFQKEVALVRRILEYGMDQQEFAKFPADTYADLFVSSLIGLRTAAVSTPIDRVSHDERTRSQTTLFVDLFLKSIHI